MQQEKPKKRKSFLRRNFDFLLILLVLLPLFYLYGLFYPVSPFEPREESFAPYERHYHFSFRFPFVTSYFLMVPENYQPEKHTYPLVLMLHGASRHMYGGKVLARPIMRENLPFFAVIPIMPFGYTWASPKTFSLRPQALPLAMSTMRSVMKNYSINENQVYVTGYSLGGIGTYAAVTRYPGVFAAAAPTDAYWNPETADRIDDVPIWIFHGVQDQGMPVAYARMLAAGLQQLGRDVRYTEYANRGHGAWIPAYENPDFWMWLIRQQKH
ncbi:MAG TPA: hypothetical protein VFQ79_20915 [Bryobacteraceae bacterium]|nr:hypothetical protein [Bryobacteraceae bacterium]